MKKLAMGAIRLYQMTLSPLLPPSCRFEPSCSHYAYTAIERFGLLRGGWMAAKRLGRCQPFYTGNLYDPVPELPVKGAKGAAKAGARPEVAGQPKHS